MNRTQLIEEVAARTGAPVEDVDKVTRVFLDVIADAFLDGEIVNIRRFGKFELRLRRGATRLNPRTRQPMQTPDKLSVTFLPSSTLRGRLNGT